jgi:hypothetical protein
MSDDRGGVRSITFVFSNEVITLPYGGGIDRPRIVNGGLRETTEVLAWLAGQAGQGMIGNIAWDAVKLGYRSLRLRLAWGEEDDKRAYISYIGQLIVAAQISQPAEVSLVSCKRQRDYWEVVLHATEKTYRVQIPPGDPHPTAISVDIVGTAGDCQQP